MGPDLSTAREQDQGKKKPAIDKRMSADGLGLETDQGY